MYEVKIKLTTNLYGRAAANLVWKLSEVKSYVYIIGENNREVNAKSLAGVLSGGFEKDEEVLVKFTQSEDKDKIIKIFTNL